jgi:3-hydroxybutyryl-CoA dehydrogenase
MLADGVAPAGTIDRAVRLGGGFRMGPFELIDLIGLDVNLGIARSFFAQGGEPERWRPSPIQERLVEEGKLGRKSGQGYYSYGEGIEREIDPELGILAPTLDPEKLALVDPAAEQILRRLFAQIANETAFALAEGVASADDLDTAMQLGLNWPLGPLSLAEKIGAGPAVELLRELERENGGAYAQAPLLLRAAAEGLELRQAALKGR